MKRISLISLFLVPVFIFTIMFSSQVFAWGAGGGVDDDMDCLDDNPNTPDNPDGSCDECGNGGDYTHSSGRSRSCCSTYPCYSAPNVCGWINSGTYTVCSGCEGSSGGGDGHDPENTIEDRSYNFGGPDGTGHESHGNW